MQHRNDSIVIKQDGKAHCSEILHQIFKHKLKVKEVPVTVLYRRFGVDLRGGITIIKDLLLAKLIDG